jgi:DNA-binding transcriptional MerR regulator
MKKIVYVKSDLLELTGVEEDFLSSWEKEKLVRPDGISDEGIPFYTAATAQKVQQIKRLVELGYSDVDILKIIRKVGLPQKEKGASAKKKVTEFLTVGRLAERAEISVRTVKHWEEKGIIESDMRSEGGFRLYSETNVFLCQLVKDLQLFGYSLDDIKGMADQYREFLAIREDPSLFSLESKEGKLKSLNDLMISLQEKIDAYKKGISRWEDLMKRMKKDLASLRSQSGKQGKKGKEKNV